MHICNKTHIQDIYGTEGPPWEAVQVQVPETLGVTLDCLDCDWLPVPVPVRVVVQLAVRVTVSGAL